MPTTPSSPFRIAVAQTVSYAGPATQSEEAPSGVLDPEGTWVKQCTADGRPGTVATDLDFTAPGLGRLWRRTARRRHGAGPHP